MKKYRIIYNGSEWNNIYAITKNEAKKAFLRQSGLVSISTSQIFAEPIPEKWVIQNTIDNTWYKDKGKLINFTENKNEAMEFNLESAGIVSQLLATVLKINSLKVTN